MGMPLLGVDLSLAGHSIRALSVGGVETCFDLAAFDALLDVGRCPPGAENRKTLLLTHGHIDHAAGLPYYVSMRNLLGRPPPRVFCPIEAAPALGRILEAWTELQAATDRCTLTGLSPGDVVPLRAGGYARAYRSPHRAPCLGYTIFRKVRKLLPELEGVPGPEIAERVKRGERVQSEIERAEISFPGDTRIEVVEREPTVRTARLLILECTFVGPDVSPKHARQGGHVHLDDIAERAELFENEVILLTHFSRRHRPEDIRAQVDARLPAGLRERVQLLL